MGDSFGYAEFDGTKGNVLLTNGSVMAANGSVTVTDGSIPTTNDTFDNGTNENQGPSPVEFAKVMSLQYVYMRVCMCARVLQFYVQLL